jgi:hypothetical protein
VLVGGGAALLVYDGGQRKEGMGTATTLHDESTMMSNACSGSQGMNMAFLQCQAELNAAQTKIDNANTGDYVAWSAVAVGGAAVLLGLTLFLVGDDPHAYDRPAPASVGVHLTPNFWTARGSGGLGLTGAF